MNKKKSQASFVNIGSSSLLVIFLVLSLVTFATLSLSSSKSDYAFSQRLAERKTSYYTACNKAEIVLGQIDETLANAYQASNGDFLKTATSQLSEVTLEAEGETILLTTDDSSKNPTVSYSVPLNETQSLSVTLVLNNATATSDGFYQIQQWKVTSNADWQGDNSVTLIKELD